MGTIYLDNAATTKVDESVVKVVNEFMLEAYGNASSQHSMGQGVRKAIEESRKKIADFIGAEPSEIIFTSGGTESNNLAIRGLALAYKDKKHIITSQIEHPCVLEVCKDLEREGYEVDYIGVNSEGVVNVNEIREKIRDDTLVVSVMHVNNEVGSVQPIEKIGAICKAGKVAFHTDGVQSFIKIDLDVKKMNIDLLTVSGHKVFAPKGVGFLYINKNFRIQPIVLGGGQEKGVRSGTENAPGIVGLTAALGVEVDKEKIKEVRERLIEGILKIPGSRLNGPRESRIYNNVNISFYGIEGEGIMLMLDSEGIMVATGSACSSTKLDESHVLRAMGVEDLYIHGSLRLTFGELSDEDISFVIEKVAEKVKRLRDMSPFKLNIPEGNKNGS